MMKENTPAATALERLKDHKDEAQLAVDTLKRIQSDISRLSGATRRAGSPSEVRDRVKALQALCKEMQDPLEVERKKAFYAWVEKRG